MHERKAAMARESDAFVALPGKSTLAYVAIVEIRKGKFWWQSHVFEKYS